MIHFQTSDNRSGSVIPCGGSESRSAVSMSNFRAAWRRNSVLDPVHGYCLVHACACSAGIVLIFSNSAVRSEAASGNRPRNSTCRIHLPNVRFSSSGPRTQACNAFSALQLHRCAAVPRRDRRRDRIPARQIVYPAPSNVKYEVPAGMADTMSAPPALAGEPSPTPRAPPSTATGGRSRWTPGRGRHRLRARVPCGGFQAAPVGMVALERPFPVSFRPTVAPFP